MVEKFATNKFHIFDPIEESNLSRLLQMKLAKIKKIPL